MLKSHQKWTPNCAVKGESGLNKNWFDNQIKKNSNWDGQKGMSTDGDLSSSAMIDWQHHLMFLKWHFSS